MVWVRLACERVDLRGRHVVTRAVLRELGLSEPSADAGTFTTEWVRPRRRIDPDLTPTMPA